MSNKILITVYIPMIEEKYDVFIYVNRKVYAVIDMLVKGIYELTDGAYNISETAILYNKITGSEYSMNTTVRDTDLRNGSKVILI